MVSDSAADGTALKRLTWEFTTGRVILLCVGAVLGGFGLGLNAAAPAGEQLAVWLLPGWGTLIVALLLSVRIADVPGESALEAADHDSAEP